MSKSQPRRAKRLDANHEQIVTWLEERGAKVFSVGEPLDLLVGWFGRWDLVEIKTPTGTVKQGQVADLVDIAARGLPPVILATTAADIETEMRRRARATTGHSRSGGCIS